MTRRRPQAQALAASCAAGMFLVILAARPVPALVVVAVAGDQAEEKAEAKLEGFSIPREPSKFVDALEDFARYRDKQAWELAFRSLETVVEAKRDGMVSAGDGFYVPSRRRVMQSLTSLPPEGRQAFRLFYDAKARKLFERAQAVAAQGGDEVGALRDIFDKYFISTVGDRAADRLGDALFEAGDFSAAGAVWGAVLNEFPDPAVPPLRLHVKRCTALARARQWSAFDEAARTVRAQFAGERLTIGGKDVAATDYLDTLRPAGASSATAPTTDGAGADSAGADGAAVADGPLQLPADDTPAWQVRLFDENLSAKLNSAFNSNNWGTQFSNLRRVVPASVGDGKRLYVNWLGIVFALDANTGKMLWRNRKFSEVGEKFANFINTRPNTDCYAAILADGRLYVTGQQLDRVGNYQEPFRLVSMSPDDGKVAWSSGSGALAKWNFIGPPLPVGDVIYATACVQNSLELTLLALGVEKGEILWQLPLGTLLAGVNHQGQPELPVPVITSAEGMLYVVTNNGAVVAVDPNARRTEWAFAYSCPPISNQQMWWNNRASQPVARMGAAAFVEGSTLYVKEEGGSAVYAVDVAGPSLLWKRPLDADSSVLPLGAGRMLFVGQELSAVDANSERRAMQWSVPLPQLAAPVEPLVAGGKQVLAFSPRGVYEIDLSDGDTLRILRGSDRDSVGGDLRLAPGRLICVSNLAITAYPVKSKESLE